jgi:acetylglutamate/LysW-gamma-L-alpha-aminoadipate kinase
MRQYPDESTLISKLSASRLPDALQFAEGRMKKKVLGAQEALSGGVRRVIIADGRGQAPISQALNGRGTIIE